MIVKDFIEEGGRGKITDWGLLQKALSQITAIFKGTLLRRQGYIDRYIYEGINPKARIYPNPRT